MREGEVRRRIRIFVGLSLFSEPAKYGKYAGHRMKSNAGNKQNFPTNRWEKGTGMVGREGGRAEVGERAIPTHCNNMTF